MSEIVQVDRVIKTIVDGKTGEVMSHTEEFIGKHRPFSVKRLNARYWQEADYLIAKNLTGNEHFLLAICKIHLTKTFTMYFTLDQLAEAGDTSRSTSKRFMRKMIEMGAVVSPKRGQYHFNPFIFSVKSYRTNEQISNIQSFWIDRYGEPITQNELAFMDFPVFIKPEVIAEHLNS